MAAHSLSATSITRPGYNQFYPNKATLNTLTPNKVLRSEWLGTISTNNFSLQYPNFRPFSRKRTPINASTSLILPTGEPEKFAATEKIPKWSMKAVKAFSIAELEAFKIHSPTTGTDSLLVGISADGTSIASQFLRADGITLSKVRDEIRKVRGRLRTDHWGSIRPPLTEDAQRALDWAVDEKIKSGGKGEITTTHILLGVWKQEESPGHKVLANLGFNDEKAKELHSLISDPRFVE